MHRVLKIFFQNQLDIGCFWVGSRSMETPCYLVHWISCQSPSLLASAKSTSPCLPMFIYHFSNTFPLHLIHSSMFDIFKTILNHWKMKLFYSKANKWSAVRVWIYLFIIMVMRVRTISWKYKASFNMILDDEFIKEIIIHEKIFHVLSCNKSVVYLL